MKNYYKEKIEIQNGGRYNLERWSAYWYQIYEVMKFNPQKILEIGVVNSIASDFFKKCNKEVVTLDINKECSPDIVASVTRMPLPDNSFDVVLAAEVLEHLPFNDFKRALKEINRVSKKNVVISVPHWGRHFSIDIRLPYFKRLRWQMKFSFFPKKHEFIGGDYTHYWEIGKRGYSNKKIKEVIRSSDFIILKDYIAFDMPYNHFFILEIGNK